MIGLHNKKILGVAGQVVNATSCACHKKVRLFVHRKVHYCEWSEQ